MICRFKYWEQSKLSFRCLKSSGPGISLTQSNVFQDTFTTFRTKAVWSICIYYAGPVRLVSKYIRSLEGKKKVSPTKSEMVGSFCNNNRPTGNRKDWPLMARHSNSADRCRTAWQKQKYICWVWLLPHRLYNVIIIIGFLISIRTSPSIISIS